MESGVSACKTNNHISETEFSVSSEVSNVWIGFLTTLFILFQSHNISDIVWIKL